MKESNVERLDEAAIYEGVHVFGSAAWDANAEEQRQGLPGFVPAKLPNPTAPNDTWPTDRQLLVGLDVKNPAFDRSPAYCRFGESFDIPRADEKRARPDHSHATPRGAVAAVAPPRPAPLSGALAGTR